MRSQPLAEVLPRISCWIDIGLWVLRDIGIRIPTIGIVQQDIRAGKLSGERVVEARSVVQEAHLAIEQLIGVAMRGGHGAPGKPLSAIGQEELDGADVAGAVQGNGGTAL